jgi:MarR family transcriptional regulator, transcriptional regulator for hemolysin
VPPIVLWKIVPQQTISDTLAAMSTPRTPPPVDLSMLLNQAGYALANRLTVALADLDMSVRVYCVLAKAAEGDHTQGRLAELAWMDKTTMVVTLDEMERRGLAERRLSPEDRRVRVVAITAKGRRQLAKADAIVQGVYDDVLDGVDAVERDTFLGVLGRLVAGPLAAPFHMEVRTRRRAQRAG